MGAVELAVILFLISRALSGGALKPLAPGAPTPSVPQVGPVPAPTPAHPPAATAPPPGTPATPQQARQATHAATLPAAFPQATPAGLPPFPGPGWRPFVPTPAAVVARASQLLPVLWARGAGARQIEQTAGQWASYVAVPGPNGRHDVNVWKLAQQQANA